VTFFGFKVSRGHDRCLFLESILRPVFEANRLLVPPGTMAAFNQFWAVESS
jgi:hypothetical protein